MTRIFESNGLRWDDGDIPVCEYCRDSIDSLHREEYTLYETPFSGDTCCDKEGCKSELIENCLQSEVIEKE